MKSYISFLIVILTFSVTSSAQSLVDLVDEVSKDGIMEMVAELSGEKSIKVLGKDLTIEHRVSGLGNNDAANYLLSKLNSYGLDSEAIDYSAGGRNIVATQMGLENPSQIYIICGHYDSTNKHGADDNASGTVAVLETARILSQYSFKNTIIYALWDEEEIGLVGARNYATKAKADGMNILGVLNMDMMAYDSNDDRQFDIDVRNIAKSYEIRDALIKAVSDFGLDLNEEVVDPGTPASDHSVFWEEGYSAVLLGEAWSVDDVTPGYHSDNDRLSLFNVNYYWEMVKLSVGFTATQAELLTSHVSELVNLDKVIIDPNPSDGIFNIDLGDEIVGKYEVINNAGQLIRQEAVNGRFINFDITAFPASNYYLKLSNERNQISILKIIKY